MPFQVEIARDWVDSLIAASTCVAAIGTVAAVWSSLTSARKAERRALEAEQWSRDLETRRDRSDRATLARLLARENEANTASVKIEWEPQPHGQPDAGTITGLIPSSANDRELLIRHVTETARTVSVREVVVQTVNYDPGGGVWGLLDLRAFPGVPRAELQAVIRFEDQAGHGWQISSDGVLRLTNMRVVAMGDDALA